MHSARGKALRPLHLAAARDQAGAVRALLAPGANATVRDARNRLPLHHAAAEDAPAATAALLVAGPGAAAWLEAHAAGGNTPLHEAIFGWNKKRSADYASTVAALLDVGANPETLNRRRRSALSAAADLELRAMQVLLVRAVEVQCFEGATRARAGEGGALQTVGRTAGGDWHYGCD